MANKPKVMPIPDDCPLELRCGRCHEVKPREKFDRNSSTPTTFSRVCKTCNAIYARETGYRREVRSKGVVEFVESLSRDIALLAIKTRILQESLDPEFGRKADIAAAKVVGGAKRRRVRQQQTIANAKTPLRTITKRPPGRPRKDNPITKEA